jgi:hypothetical protein
VEEDISASEHVFLHVRDLEIRAFTGSLLFRLKTQVAGSPCRVGISELDVVAVHAEDCPSLEIDHLIDPKHAITPIPVVVRRPSIAPDPKRPITLSNVTTSGASIRREVRRLRSSASSHGV